LDFEKALNIIKKNLVKLWGFIISDKKRLQQIITGIVIGFVAIGMTTRLLSPSLKHFCRWVIEQDTKEESFSLQTIPVDVLEVKPQTVYKRIYAIGELKGKSAATIKSELQSSARIKNIPMIEGEHVEKDTVLIEFDDAENKGRYQAAVAAHKNAKANFNRSEKLFKSKNISQNEYDKSKGDFEKTKGDEDTAKAQLEKTVIKAPFSGTVGIVENFRIGDVVRPDVALMTIVDDSKIHVDIPIASKHFSELSKNQEIVFTVEAYPDQTFRGHVTALDSVIRPETRTLLVRAEVDNENGTLKPGLMGDVQIITGMETEAFKIPEAAIVSMGEESFVFVSENEKAQRRKVIKSFAIGNDRVIDDGLKAGNLVVSVASLRLMEGSPLSIKSINEMSKEEWLKKQNEKTKKVSKNKEK